MNTAIRQIHHFSNNPSAAAVTTVTFSQMRPRYIDKCVEANPRQIVKIDILGDLVELPVYALRRRNAMVQI
ncbi:hypothetical protein INT48_002615 [Thamnidium elegans]|uniref:Uncharacterized protein n=1 Tax=Thamnidium elegans TaxID=101142 RepID=A0A8H7T1A5_9FUNG|nr:hypothetical protein INT48_002615 [Thamnidium elegans]